ncbi:MAG: helical backbone metal receptor [Thermodesulfovibrionales bacterium]
MRKAGMRAALLAALALLALAAPPVARTALGFERIVSLAPSMTETLYALGLGDKVVGVTAFCDYPPEAREKPAVGGMSNPSLEAVVSLRPDLVVLTTDGNPKEFEERLRSLGIRTYVFRARTMGELPAGIREMGEALGVGERAGALASRMEATFREMAVGAARPARRVLFLIWPEPLIVAGPGTAMDDALRLLGQKNIVSESGVGIGYPKYSVEEVLRQAPEVIFIGKGHADMRKLSRRLLDRLRSTPAVREGKVFFVSDRLYRLGPRVPAGVEELAALLDELGGKR